MAAVTSEQFTREKCIEVFDYHAEKYPNKIFPDTDQFFMLVVRGHYLDSVGKRGQNDINQLDDLIVAVTRSNDFYVAVKGNCDPSFIIREGRELAKLDPGVIRYYRGDHKSQYLAFRPFPEGVRLACTRNGHRADCASTNHHGCRDEVDGIGYDTWSEGCITQPITFFKTTFRPQCYEQIAKFHNTIAKVQNPRKLGSKDFDTNGETKHFPIILVEKRLENGVQRVFSATGEALEFLD
jgi:hypothetical protein